MALCEEKTIIVGQQVPVIVLMSGIITAKVQKMEADFEDAHTHPKMLITIIVRIPPQ